MKHNIMNTPIAEQNKSSAERENTVISRFFFFMFYFFFDYTSTCAAVFLDYTILLELVQQKLSWYARCPVISTF